MLIEIPFLNTSKRTVAFLKGIQDEIGNLVVTMHPGSRKKHLRIYFPQINLLRLIVLLVLNMFSKMTSIFWGWWNVINLLRLIVLLVLNMFSKMTSIFWGWWNVSFSSDANKLSLLTFTKQLNAFKRPNFWNNTWGKSLLPNRATRNHPDENGRCRCRMIFFYSLSFLDISNQPQLWGITKITHRPIERIPGFPGV